MMKHQCSRFALIAHIAPQNLLTCHLIYQLPCNPFTRLVALAFQVTIVVLLGSENQNAASLRTAIGSRRLLLIISGAWTVENVMALQIGGIGCAHVVTTQLSEVALAFDQKGAITIA
ncbi:MAG TPA: hypothetical protein VGL94_19140 [Ktedonobacteraceae bacterium]